MGQQSHLTAPVPFGPPGDFGVKLTTELSGYWQDLSVWNESNLTGSDTHFYQLANMNRFQDVDGKSIKISPYNVKTILPSPRTMGATERKCSHA